MPQPGMCWRHVVINTHNSWLPGDPRGFHAFRHKIHSTGDYKNPPPPGEHAGLFRYSQKISGEPVVIPRGSWPIVGKAILKKLQGKLGYRVLALSVGATHTHIQGELPDDLRKIRHIKGQCKTVASHAIREVLPGRVWSRDGTYKRIDDADYQRNVYQYILAQEDAWIWSYKDPPPE